MSKPRSQICREWRERNPEKVKAYTKKYSAENPEKIKANNAARKNRGYYGGATQNYANSPVGWCRYKIASLKRSSKLRNLDFDLDYKYLLDLMTNTCPVFEIPIDYSLGRGKGRISINSPSIDRIDNELGYIRGNVLIVSQLANQVKYNLTLQEIQDLLPKMIEFYKGFIND